MSIPNDPNETEPQAPVTPPAVAAPAPAVVAPSVAATAATPPPFNLMAIIAFVGAFIIPVVGIVCGHITLAEYRKGLPERGREYALAGTILGYIFTVVWLLLGILWIVFLFTHSARAIGGYDYQPLPGRGFPIPSPRFTPNG